MKSIVYAAVVCFLFFTSCKKELYSTSVTTIPGTITVNPNHPMKDSLTAIVQKHLGKGVPGVQVMVKNANGLFIVNGGYSKIETKQLITDNMATWIYSISKTYMATVILKLAERGLIKLDTPAAAYLSAHVLDPLAMVINLQFVNYSIILRVCVIIQRSLPTSWHS